MADEKFKLPGTSYEELAKIIRAYDSIDREAKPAEVGNVAGKHETFVSRTNGFLLGVGIIEGGAKGKRVTLVGHALALAMEHGQEQEIATQWREILAGNDFIQKVLSAVRVRKGMDRATLVSHVAYTAGQAKTPSNMAGANAVVDVLLLARLLEETNGKLTTSTAPQQEEASATEVYPPGFSTYVLGSPVQTGPAIRFTEGAAIQGIPSISSYTRVPFEIRLDVTVQCSPDDLDTLGARIQKFVNDLRREASQQGE